MLYFSEIHFVCSWMQRGRTRAACPPQLRSPAALRYALKGLALPPRLLHHSRRLLQSYRATDGLRHTPASRPLQSAGAQPLQRHAARLLGKPAGLPLPHRALLAAGALRWAWEGSSEAASCTHPACLNPDCFLRESGRAAPEKPPWQPKEVPAANLPRAPFPPLQTTGDPSLSHGEQPAHSLGLTTSLCPPTG